MIHLSSLIYPIFYYFNDSRICIVAITSFIFFAVLAVDFMRSKNKELNHLFIKYFKFSLRESEMFCFTGATYFMLGTVCTFLFFQKSVAIIAIFVLVISDSAASIIGLLYGKNKLVGDKSMEGTLAFFISAIVISCVGHFIFGIHVFPLLIASLVATIFELLSKELKIDDNILIPMGYALASSIFYL